MPNVRSILGVICPLALAAILVGVGCGRTIEEEDEPIVHEHRVQPCKDWCAMLFDPGCKPTELLVADEDACFATCTEQGLAWGELEDGTDACAAEHAASIACRVALPCADQRAAFALINVVPAAERPCGEELVARLDCVAEHVYGR